MQPEFSEYIESFSKRFDPELALMGIDWSHPIEDILTAMETALAPFPAPTIASHPLVHQLPGLTTDNPYWEIIKRLPIEPHPWRRPLSTDGFFNRRAMVKQFSWAIPSPFDLAVIKQTLDGRAVTEMGAGAGYWAWQLAQSGIDITAYDVEAGLSNTWHERTEYWHPVEEAAAGTINTDEALLLVWPLYDHPMAARALEAHHGDMLIYVGEPEDGCTADEEFFTMLDADWEEIAQSEGHPTFYGINCDLTIHRRK